MLVRKACSVARFKVLQMRGVVFPDGEPVELISIGEWRQIHTNLGLIAEELLPEEYALAVFSYVTQLAYSAKSDLSLIATQAWEDVNSSEVSNLKKAFHSVVSTAYKMQSS